MEGPRKKYSGLKYSPICHALPNTAPYTTLCCKVRFACSKKAKVPVIARETGHTGFKCPESVPVRPTPSKSCNQSWHPKLFLIILVGVLA
eukprot:5356230-Pleurochrysis_carterae.AAC.1